MHSQKYPTYWTKEVDEHGKLPVGMFCPDHAKEVDPGSCVSCKKKIAKSKLFINFTIICLH